jgi:hypothetical protein
MPLNRLGAPNNTVSVPDVDATKLSYWPITGAVWATIGGLCSQAGGSLVYRLIFTDHDGVLTGVSPPVTLTAGAGGPDFGTQWLGTPNADPTTAVAANRMALKVDAIVGVWELNAQVSIPRKDRDFDDILDGTPCRTIPSPR